MYKVNFAQPQGGNQVSADKYLDMGITNILELPKLMFEKEQSFDVDKYILFNKILVNLLENIALASNKIKPLKPSTNLDELSEDYQELRRVLREFYKKNDPELGAGSVFKADMIVRFILEGEYPTRITIMETKLNEQIHDGKITQEIADSQLANYKLQVIMRSSIRSKARKVDIDA
jgi:hypothetical protein